MGYRLSRRQSRPAYHVRRWLAALLCVCLLLTFQGPFAGAMLSSGDMKQTISRVCTDADGNTYAVEVSFGPDAQIPDDAVLQVEELPWDSADFGDYLARTETALGCESGTVSYVRILDISLVSEQDPAVSYQPAAGALVEVLVQLEGEPDRDLCVVHFAEEEQPQVLENSVSGDVLSFETTGFSVYAIVDAPEPATTEIMTVETLAELQADPDAGFLLSVNRTTRPSYFTRNTNANSAFLVSENISQAETWYFEPITGAENQYYIYTLIDGEPQYIHNQSGNLAELSSQGSAFVLSQAAGGTFYLKLAGENKWLQYSGSGTGIRFWTDNNNAANSRVTLTYAASTEPPFDPYGLDGKTYGIAYQNDVATAAALMAEPKDASHLVAKKMLMRPDVLDYEGVLLVAENSDITDWTFHCVQGDKYYITAQVDGATKYLTVSGQSVTLASEPSDASLVTVTPGTGSNAGKYSFTVGGYSIEPHLNGTNTDRGFRGSNSASAAKWLNLVTRSVLNDDDFNLYYAKKVSVSDTVNVFDGQQVVLYTRIWDDDAKQYVFYVVNHDGTLIRSYDTGDGIEWFGSQVNTALWTFTEYTNTDGTPNYYYELQNTQYGEYIAPQLSSNQITQGGTIGINLNGRRYGENYTTIIAWDDAQYAYAGLRTENGHVVPGVLLDAEDFYFAVINPVDIHDELTTVRTIDNDMYGIKMSMFDFNNRVVSNRDADLNAFMGGKGGKGMMSTDLGEDGYPIGTMSTGTGQGRSFGELIENHSDGANPVNHLFIESIYNESGYFEYNSTQNFAHLNADGTFTVYDQLGAITGHDEHKITREHGQFMPYDNISPGDYAYDANGELITNRTDVLAYELPDTNPRKGEKLYRLGSESDVDYFFGMEMEASFTQTASGLDAWGHDIIFEFSGDDDFWLYVDGELVIDLGGEHAAQVGTVNFRTGIVTYSIDNSTDGGASVIGTSTIYEIFRNNYQQRGLSQSEIETKLYEIFEQNDAGQYVFRDYTNHTMKMLYMERGAGASNLHMRFNLAAVKPGTILLSKKLSGTDNESNSLVSFPYQIYYTTQSDSESQYHLLEERTGDSYNVTYKDTTTPVPFRGSYTVGGNTYQNVFLLNPGQTAEIDLPDETVDYYIVECGVNTDVYDVVTVNGTELSGVGTGVRQDFATTSATMEDRPKVDYDNHVKEGAVRSMSITKKLYDSDGQTVLTHEQDNTLFSFRLYLGDENADPTSLPTANLYPYFVKDPQGNYCRWDAATQSFVSLGITDYASLSAYLDAATNAERAAVIFSTSMYGSISKIPAGYTVEVRDLIAGTQWKAEERDYEIPKGYTLRLSDGYQRTDTGENTGTTPISGTIQANETPEVLVSNQKGWGLTVEKVWSDKDFMETHDDIYFAVYVNGAENTRVLLENSVRRLSTAESSIYYFFGNLESTTPFSDYEIAEVEVTPGPDFAVDSNGVVTGYTAVTPIAEGGTLTIGGTPAGGTYTENGFDYTVYYEPGEQTTQNENVRTDTVTNARPGIRLIKTDWSGNALPGAVFTLTDAQQQPVAAASYTSAADGLITTAYLNAGVYTLTETAARKGYLVLPDDLIITVGSNGEISVSGLDQIYYDYTPADGDEMATITIRNRTASLEVLKTDGETNEPLADTHFALYRQVIDNTGTPRKDYEPIAGYADLVTDENGVLENVTMDLAAGTYYLTETAAAEGYRLLTEDLCFTIGRDGTVTVNSQGHSMWLREETDLETGHTAFILTIPNVLSSVKVTFVKVDGAHPNVKLQGAMFDLYRVDDPSRTLLLTALTSDAQGILWLNGQSQFELADGLYELVETRAPLGYYMLTQPVTVVVAGTSVQYDDGTARSQSGAGLSGTFLDGFTLEISNKSGFEMPDTGGNALWLALTGGALLSLGAGMLLMRLRRKGKRDTGV